MKPVEPRHENDCAASALAALLEVPIEDVPDFWATSVDGPAMVAQAARWLRGYGWHLLYARAYPPRHLQALAHERRERGDTWPPRGYWIGQFASVEALRDHEPTHVAVMRDRRVAFNPGGTARELHEPDIWLIAYYLLVPLDPAAQK